jgi:hypothetical protein
VGGREVKSGMAIKIVIFDSDRFKIKGSGWGTPLPASIISILISRTTC